MHNTIIFTNITQTNNNTNKYNTNKYNTNILILIITNRTVNTYIGSSASVTGILTEDGVMKRGWDTKSTTLSSDLFLLYNICTTLINFLRPRAPKGVMRSREVVMTSHEGVMKSRDCYNHVQFSIEWLGHWPNAVVIRYQTRYGYWLMVIPGIECYV